MYVHASEHMQTHTNIQTKTHTYTPETDKYTNTHRCTHTDRHTCIQSDTHLYGDDVLRGHLIVETVVGNHFTTSGIN